MVQNKQILKNVFFWISALVVLVVFWMASVKAQDSIDVGNGLRISPVRQELILSPGQIDSYDIEITNVSQGDMTVISLINDFESDNETGQPKLLVREDESSPFSLKEYVTLPEPFALKAGDSKTVTIDVSLPSNLAPGGYFGAVRFAPGVEGDVEPGNVALTASVGSLLLVSVPGDVAEGMTLDNIEPRKDGNSGTFFENSPDTIAITLKITGNTILKPYGQVSVKDIFGNEVYSYEFNGGQLRGNVLPQSNRTFEDPLQNIGRIGRYTAEANISYGEGGGTILTGKTTFWVIPWKIILIAVIIIAVVIWFTTKGVKSYNRRVVSKAKRNS